MSTLHDSGVRLVAWARAHVALLVAAALGVAFAVAVFVTTYRLYDARRRETAALVQTQIAFCIRGNDLRSELRDYVHQTIVIVPVPAGLDSATAAAAEARNAAAQAALDRADRSFAAVDCDALAAKLKGTR